MTIQEAYIKLLTKVNKDNTNDNIHIDRGRFVLIFNEQQNRWLDEEISKNDYDSLNQIQELLVHNKDIKNGNQHQDHFDFDLPTDYFHYVTSYSKADKGNCKNKIIRNWIINSYDLNEKLRDEYSKPSFEYEETIATIANNKIQVYIDNFTITELVFTYYRYPRKVDIAGYIKIDQTPSINIDPELSDIFVDRILNRCAEEVMRDFENQEGLMNAKDRTKNE